MDDTNDTSSADRPISRRTALLGLLGGSVGTAVGYDRLIQSDEPTLAANVDFGASDPTIEAEGFGRLKDAFVSSEKSEIEIRYNNFLSGAKDKEFGVRLAARPHVGGRDPSEWGEPDDDSKPDDDDLGALLAEMEADEDGVDYIIEDVRQLQAVKGDLESDYKLGTNIDARVTRDWDGGFDPIWDPGDAAFEGTLDGGGYKIYGLHIEDDGDGVGLVGANQGTIKNLGLLRCEITGDDGTGGIVGANGGDVENVHVVDCTIEGGDAVGGLVGLSDGAVKESYAENCSIEGENIVGGLVGSNLDTAPDGDPDNDKRKIGDIEGSYARCKVEADGDSAGGLAGINIGEITRAYSAGTVEASNIAGGLVGSNILDEDEDDPGGLIGIIGDLLGVVIDLLAAVIGILANLVGALLGLGADGEDRDIVNVKGDDLINPGEIEQSVTVVESISIDEDEDDDEAIGGFAGLNDTRRDDGDLGAKATIDSSYWCHDVLDELDSEDGTSAPKENQPDGLTALEREDMEDDLMGDLDSDEWEARGGSYPQLQSNPEPSDVTIESGDETDFETILKTEVEVTDVPHGTIEQDYSELDETDDISLAKHDKISDDFIELESSSFDGPERVKVETDIDLRLTVEFEPYELEETAEATSRITVEKPALRFDSDHWD